MLENGKMGRLRRVFKGIYKVNRILRPANLDYRNKSGNDKCWKLLLSTGCKFFKYPSPADKSATSPSRGEVTGLLRCARNDVHCLGRSMIEMLGVLAIIGVLSVGGIAGYSKAMQQYKVNKWKAQITDLIFAVKDAYKMEKNFGAAGTNLLPFLKQIEAVPQDMLDEDNKDLFGNRVSIDIRNDGLPDGSRLQRFAMYFMMPPSTISEQNCRELNYFTQTDSEVHTVVNWANGYRTCGKYVEDAYKRINPCSEYDMHKVAENCKICKENSCTLILLYRNN